MTCFSGKDGSLKFGGNAVGRVRSWSLNSTLETLESTALGDNARTYCAGLKSATGSASVWYHADSSFSNMLNNCVKVGATGNAGDLELIWGSKKVVFKAFVNSVAITCTTGEVMAAEVSFQMTGDYTTATL